MDNYKNIRKVIINDNKDDIVIIKKNLNTSLSFSDILYDKVILPKEKLSSSYNYNILDISNLNNKELVTLQELPYRSFLFFFFLLNF